MQSVTSGERLLWRVEEAAGRLALARSTLYELIARGELPVLKIGRATRITDDALRAWIARQSASETDV
jgi:excisionase family DNA binding protein